MEGGIVAWLAIKLKQILSSKMEAIKQAMIAVKKDLIKYCYVGFTSSAFKIDEDATTCHLINSAEEMDVYVYTNVEEQISTEFQDLAIIRLFSFSLDHFSKFTFNNLVKLANCGLYEKEDGHFSCAYCTFEESNPISLFAKSSEEINMLHRKAVPECQLFSNPLVLNVTVNVTNCFDFKRESHRLISFLQNALPWTPLIKIQDLAKSGYYYAGPEDNVICFFCRVQIRGWEDEDTAEGEHKRWSPNCPFVTGKCCHNVPLEEEPMMLRNELAKWRKVHTSSTAKIFNRGLPFSKLASLMIDLEDSKYPKFCLLADRLATYLTWPVALSQRPERLAKAGFFYTGIGDRVICFHCGLGLKDFAPTDDPFEEHAKWNPICGFILATKGSDFVKAALLCKPAPITETVMMVENEMKPQIVDSVKMVCSQCQINNIDSVNIACGHMTLCWECNNGSHRCEKCTEEHLGCVKVLWN